MNQLLIDASKSLISITSTKENPKALDKVLNTAKNILNQFNYEKFTSNQIPSFLFFNTQKRPEKFKVILNAHLDVVPAPSRQFKPIIKENKLYGRGAIDMKAAAASEILVFKEVADKINYPLGLQLVVDEEVGGFNGTKYQLDKGVKTDFVIAGEPTNLNLSVMAKGILWLKIKASGVTGHAAYPWQGKNAIWLIKKFLDSLENIYPVPKRESWITTANLANIQTTNTTFNKIPDECSIMLDIRYIPDDSKNIIKSIEGILPTGFSLETVTNEPAQFTDKSNHFVASLANSIKKVTGRQPKFIPKHGASDIRHYQPHNTPATLFGPIGNGLHSDNEWVDLKSLDTHYHVLKNFLTSI